MPETGLSSAPKVARAALVQLVQDIVGIVPNIVVFQYNPERLTHALTPWNPFETDQTQRGAQAPTVQPFNPRETFSLAIELDAADDLEDGNPVTSVAGIADRLAALKKLTLPSKGLLGDLIASATALVGASSTSAQAQRPTVPIVLFVWGPGRILPVRITSFSVEETLFSPTLYPLQAKATLSLEVLTPDVFKCQRDPTADLAVAAYNLTKTQEDALAIANIAQASRSILSLLPF
jgi:hypothetical protein